uniref:Uncharacterized protein n=1 Tax=Nelumbo nucifera TaxID=4432 RepID=A0A822ZIA7_NELNU|nr:TPA_asm: hypothetical protein HUJ06_000986 [Nelumbo nucifera]
MADEQVNGICNLSIQDQVFESQKGIEGAASTITLSDNRGFCAICLEKIELQETALVKGCEHAYWFVQHLYPISAENSWFHNLLRFIWHSFLVSNFGYKSLNLYEITKFTLEISLIMASDKIWLQSCKSIYYR